MEWDQSENQRGGAGKGVVFIDVNEAKEAPQREKRESDMGLIAVIAPLSALRGLEFSVVVVNPSCRVFVGKK